MINIPKLSPFKHFCVTVGNLPTSYKDSLTYYEMLEWFCKYLSETVIPAVNTNAEAVTELQNFVEHYFDNLDVQEEINNKLDEMAESGQLTDIIAQYLGLAGVLVYNTISEMKEATNLAIGSVTKTLGYRNINDGGSCYYKVREIINTDVVDEKILIALSDVNLVAELVITSDYITPEMLGAYGDGLHDDTDSVKLAINYANSNNLVTKLNKTYLITSQMEVNGSIDGENIGKLITNSTQRFTGAMLYSDSNLVVKNLNFDCKSNIEFVLADKFIRYNNAIKCNGGNLYIENCTFHELYNCFIDCDNNAINKIDIINNKFYADNKTNVYYASHLSISSIINSNATITIKNNEFHGFEYEYVGTYDNDTNINAGGIILANINVDELIIDSNTFDHLGRYGSINGNLGLSRICVLDFYYNVHNAKITNNKLLNCHWIPIRIHGSNNTIIDNNIITVARDCTESLMVISDTLNSTGEQPVGTDNLIISNNTFRTISGVYEKGITINGYSSLPDDKGFYGSVDNLKIINNILDVKCKKLIFFDPSLKKCIIKDNTIYDEIDNANINILYPQDEALMTTSTHGVDYSDTYIDFIGNNCDVGGSSITFRNTVTPSIATLNADIICNVYKNNLKNTKTGYVIYGTTDDNLTIIDNILYGVGGVNTAKTAYNNIAFYKSTGVGFYQVTNSENNSSYIVN